MADRYAEGTTVSTERSRLELEKLLRRFGASAFGYWWEHGAEQVAFTIAGRNVRITVPIPEAESELFTVTPGGKRRSEAAALEAYAAEVRRRWRSLLLVIKAKLAAVDDGISTLDREFLADVVLATGETFGEWIAPQLDEIDQGKIPIALPRGAR